MDDLNSWQTLGLVVALCTFLILLLYFYIKYLKKQSMKTPVLNRSSSIK